MFGVCVVVLGCVYGASFIALGEAAKYPNLKHFDYVNPSAPKGGVLKSYALGSFSSLNPFVLNGEPAAGLEFLYDTLMAQSMDEPYAQYALVASDVAVAPSGDSVVFTIDSRARFSDGVPITAYDVEFSFEMMRTLGSPLYKQYYADVQSTEVLDSRHIKFIFATNNNKELPLILGQLSVLPKHFYMRNGVNTFGKNPLEIPLGSGAYKIARFEVGKYIVYERNPNYWARDLPSRIGYFNFDSMHYEYYRDDSVALQAFLNHRYDWRLETAAKVWARGYEGKALQEGMVRKIVFEHSLPSGMQGFFMNMRKSIFQNPLVREALIYAFNFEWSNENLFFSQYERTQSFFNHSVFASTHPLASPQLKALEQCGASPVLLQSLQTPYKIPSAPNATKERENLKYARDLLMQAGFIVHNGVAKDRNSTPLRFTLLLDNPAFERLAVRYERNLKMLGIQLEIQKLDTSQYINRIKDFDFDMIVGIIPQSLFPGNEQRYFWSSQSAHMPGSKNYSGIASPIVDCLIERVIGAKNRKEQIQMVRTLDRVLLAFNMVVPHYFLPRFRVAMWDHIGVWDTYPRYDINPAIWWDRRLEHTNK